MGDSLISEAARELRKRQTEAEITLWSRLKSRQLNSVKFRRQEPIGSYVVDFVSFKHKLILEIDGSPHKSQETKFKDMQRTAWLHEQGFKILRFWNSEVVNDTEKVLVRIKDNLKRLPPSPGLSHQGRGMDTFNKASAAGKFPSPSVGEGQGEGGVDE